MIINTGMRTDIPAFYSQWFMNRIRAGYVYTRNPYYRHQVTRYNLAPEVVDCLAFCTKDPTPMLKYLDELKAYKMFWFVTITPYGKDIEPNVADKRKIIESFKKLSTTLGIDTVSWRYDPIVIAQRKDVKWHINAFRKMAQLLKGYTTTCVISFLDLYEKVKKNAPDLRPPTKEEQIELAKAFYTIGKENGITIRACLEDEFLKEYGIDCSGCMSKEIVEKAIKASLNAPKKKNVRVKCNCLLGNDIGAYNTCAHLCRYCYANSDKSVVIENMKKHNVSSAFLIGDIEEGDIITEAKQKSWKLKEENRQISFFRK